jgi:adenylate kinase family enzyme
MSPTISLVGLPGAGKTSLCRSLAKHLISQCFVLGDELRAYAAKDLALQDLLARGELAPESLVVRLVQEAALRPRPNSLVVDGFPRHPGQVTLCRTLFSRWTVFFLDIDPDEAVRRLSNRMLCSTCGWLGSQSANILPKCPQCGLATLHRRPEDEPAILLPRIAAATSRLSNLLSSLSGVPVFHLDASLPPERVLRDAVSHFQELLTDIAGEKP